MIENQPMGSQTLEILRQGVWASLTGGWFYDPHQDVFCNTFHLYLWLFLLCLPFTIFVYFPPTQGVWYFYSGLVIIALATIKLINYGLHHMYDTTECIHEEIEDDWKGQKREEEGIELQVLSNKPVLDTTQQQNGSSFWVSSYAELGLASTDVDSVESEEFHRIESNDQKTSTIDLKAEVHRKNSSESSEEIVVQPSLEIVTFHTKVPDNEKEQSKSDQNSKRPLNSSSNNSNVNNRGATSINISENNRNIRSSLKKRLAIERSDELLNLSQMQNDFDQSNLNLTHTPRRHSNFTNSSLTFIPTNIQTIIKPTGSLELGYIDSNGNDSTEGFYFKPNNNNRANKNGVRRIRSTCWPRPSLSLHPNSFELISGNVRNPKTPHPDSPLIRHQHLNLCPYFGSEIVYPIAEQSDEHQTSHGPDTDLESFGRNSDSDYEENNQGSRSPLLVRLPEGDCIKVVQEGQCTVSNNSKKIHDYHSKYLDKSMSNFNFCRSSSKSEEADRSSATSKDALLDNDNSNSSATPEMQDARTDCFATDNECSDKKLSECSNLSYSNSSIEYDNVDHSQLRRSSTIKLKQPDSNTSGCVEVKHLDDTQCDDNYVETKNEVLVAECSAGPSTGAIKRKLCKKNRRRKVNKKEKDVANCSSLIELDLDWLFDDENEHLKYTKDPNKKDLEWSSTTTVSLEQDVSKVLQEPVPSARSLGAIPKKITSSSRNSYDNDGKSSRRISKSESDRIRRKHNKEERHFNRNRSMCENKVTNAIKPNETSVEGLECLVVPMYQQQRLRKLSAPRRSRVTRHRNESYQEPSTSTLSNNELSTLLPAPPLLQAFLASKRDYMLPIYLPADSLQCRLKRTRGNRNISQASVRPPTCIVLDAPRTHCAKSFNDTSDGSVHYFMDECGKWISYTFDEKGSGTANSQVNNNNNNNNSNNNSRTLHKGLSESNNVNQAECNREIWENSTESEVCNSSISEILSNNTTIKTSSTSTMIPCVNKLNVPRMPNQVVPMYRGGRDNKDDNVMLNVRDVYVFNETHEQDIDVPTDQRKQFHFIRTADALNNHCPRTRSYYKFKVFPWVYIKVTLDRLKLLALLDRNLTLSEALLSIFLGVLVSIFGATLLYLGFYNDFSAFVFCFIIASCQYSLLKSVQPDAASPTHGFNRIIAYSRPIYFCIFSSIILLLHTNINNDNYYVNVFKFYGFEFTNRSLIVFIRDFFVKFLLFFPILFSLGLFPQINTFVLYFLEQIDMHVFGGNAMSSLLAAFYCLFRSFLAVIAMYGLAFGGLSEPKGSQHILFSMFSACLISSSYHLSRSASDPSNLWNILKAHLWPPDLYREKKESHNKTNAKTTSNKSNNSTTTNSEKNTKQDDKTEEKKTNEKKEIIKDDVADPLPYKLQKTVNARLKNDVLLCGLIALLVFGIHSSTVFTVLQPELSPVLWCIASVFGFILHYVIPQMRKQLPWLCIARPILRSQEYEQYQIRGPAKIMWFEKAYVYLCFLERNILYPLVFLAALTEDSPRIINKFGTLLGALFVVVCGIKALRGSYSDQSSQYLILTFTALFFKFDYTPLQESFLIDYFVMSIVYHKAYEWLLKIRFVVTYIAPWQITWGSAFHAFAQPFSVPHSAMLFLQAFISAILSTPLNPFLGSAIFLTSYVRPVKFWERDYNTRRVDHSNTPLSSHLERNLGADDNNLNSIFYEHLTRSLQHSLCGDLIMGRWGLVSQGDCFVLASDYLNCLVHIIELGNGLVTFQMRGLEFRGTYCQQREVEAITEGVEENDGCCCCDPGHLPNMLSVNAAFNQRWLAWEVTASKYILEGYSISDNSALSMLQVFDFRKVLITYYVKSIIFYASRSTKLDEWLNSQTIFKALESMQDKNFVDLDPVFNINIDEDYDIIACGMTKSTFFQVYGDWIAYCAEKSQKNIEATINSNLTLLCFALSLLGRRTLGAASHNTVSSVEFFLYGLHALFKGDFRITCARDEWVFTDMDLLKTVVAPGVRMSLKLHQDHFMSPDEYEELSALYDAICTHEEELVISHEGDPAWRSAVLSGTPSLLALRHVLDDGTDEYKIIMLNKRHLTFRVIKINKECVRGLWAGQQQELVYLRNRNPERGSIQNAKQVLRNIINSSCDQPIGYPIYVSPLTTSYAETNEQLCSLIGGSISLTKIRNFTINLFRRIRKRCGEGFSSGGSGRDELGLGNEGVYVMAAITALNHHNTGSQSTDGSHLGGSIGRGSSLSRMSLANRGSLASMGKPTSSTLASLAGLFKERDERNVSQAPDAQTDEKTPETDCVDKEVVSKRRVRIVDPNLVFDCINLGRRIDVSWPNEHMRVRGGRSYWRDWLPEGGMEGRVVHKWIPCHKDPSKRSHVDRTILLVHIDDKYVPIAESGVQDLGAEV